MRDTDAVNEADFDELLDRLGYATSDQVVVVALGKETTVFNCQGVAGATEVVMQHQKENLFFNVNEMRPLSSGQQRGSEGDVVRVAALVVDLDYKEGGVADEDAGLSIIQELGEWLGTAPCAVVRSGHGLHAYWPLTDALVDDFLRQQMLRWRTLVQRTAAEFDAKVDNVFDLARMLRVPGSWNRKERPCRRVTAQFTDRDDYEVLDVNELSVRLDEACIPTPPVDALSRATVAPMANWKSAASTCAYVHRMVTAWQTDSPTARHPWVVSQSVRLAAALRLGCITVADAQEAKAALHRRFEELIKPDGDRRRLAYAKREVEGAWQWAVIHVESMTDSECERELGDHEHSVEEGDLAWDEDDDEGFWTSRPLLEYIRREARASMVSPWALLGAFLTRTGSEIAPDVLLPATVGERVSLNLFSVFVGLPGAGKSSAMATCDGLRQWSAVSFDLGTTEGLVDMFAIEASKAKNTVPARSSEWHPEIVLHHARGIAKTDEVSSLEAQASRRGNLLLPTMLTVYTGEEIRPAYRVNKSYLPRQSVRICWMLGAQYDTAGYLLREEERGLPQRFVWFATNDPNASDEAEPPSEPLEWEVPDVVCGDSCDSLVIELDATIRRQIRRERKATLRGTYHGSSKTPGHRNLSKLKVAAILGLLDGRTSVTVEDWELAEHIMQHSDRQIERVRRHGRRAQEKKNQATGRKLASVESSKELEMESRLVSRCGGIIGRRVWKCVDQPDPSFGLTRSDLRDALGRSKSKPGFDLDASIQFAIEKGWIERAYRPHPKKPGKMTEVYLSGPVEPVARAA